MNLSTGKYWDAGWNPIVGCRRISTGCDRCYALANACRMAGNPNPKVADRYLDVLCGGNGEPDWNWEVRFSEDVLTSPLKRKKPTVYFNSMSDPFRQAVPDEWLDWMFAVMALCSQHTFLLCTKRSERMREYLSDTDRYLKIMKSLENGKIIWGSGLPDRTIARLWKSARTKDIWPFPNVWLGVTAENQKRANERIPVLLDTPAAVRFVSVEPMLGPVNLTRLPAEVAFGSKYRGIYTNALVGGGRETSSPWKLNWVIVGGETGPGARPMHPDWPRSLRDQCVGAGVPFFFKQWGEWSPGEGPPNKTDYVPTDGYLLVGDPALNVQPMVRVGRAKAGRILDGREWNEMPGKDKERSHGHERRF